MGDYPRLLIDNKKLYENAMMVRTNCEKVGISIAGVVKGFCAVPKAAEAITKAGIKEIATSRIDQIKKMKDDGIDAPFMLIRIPMMSEVEELVEYVDISLESELSVIEKINEEAIKKNKVHEIILMADLGDLREGFWDKEEMAAAAEYIEKNLKGIYLKGIGTNLGCYGSIKATPEKMNELIAVSEKIEEKIGRKLEYISGGATSSYTMVLDKTMPQRINHLRIGEEIILAYDLEKYWGYDMHEMHQDAFIYETEVLEVKEKPSHPVGEIFIDCFGDKAVYEDKGMMKRAVLGSGRLDHMSYEMLIPLEEGLELLGDSSDHLLCDVTRCRKLVPGDIVRFKLCYAGVLFTTSSDYVKKVNC